MKTKHTQGEWVISEYNPNYIVDSQELINQSIICQVYGSSEIQEANALLIAAAPDLLEFIKRMVSESNFIDEKDKQDAISLIKKAKGE